MRALIAALKINAQSKVAKNLFYKSGKGKRVSSKVLKENIEVDKEST